MKRLIIIICFVLIAFGVYKGLSGIKDDNIDIGEPVDYLSVDNNFSASVFLSGLSNPRVIIFDDKDNMLISEPDSGKVYKTDENGKYTVLLQGLNKPHGLALYTASNQKTYLYVANTDGVLRYIYDSNSSDLIDNSSGEEIATLPADGRH